MENNSAASKTNGLRKRAFVSVVATAVLGWASTFLAVEWFMDYASGLFLWLPFVLGAVSTLLYRTPVSGPLWNHLRLPFYTLITYCLGLVVFAVEGVICILMALPIAIPIALLGHWLSNLWLRKRKQGVSAGVLLLVVSVPLLMAFEDGMERGKTLRPITTSVIVEAAPEEVWKNVVSFSKLAPPTEAVFKAGIAYPIEATITGTGVGAVRRCRFSTGAFVEPITVWDEPRLLRFSVQAQPEPLKEISPYELHPKHLHGYWVSKEGQFKLTRLANGYTLLEGTTWYVSKMEPAFYWNYWSDYMVHTIHKRVLEHIRMQSVE